MAPEAYTLTAAIEAFVQKGDVREAAARAYDKYQKCGLKAARRLFR
jgi:pentatricopeptide repeat protein